MLVPRPYYNIYGPSFQGGSTENLAFIGHVVSKKRKFENNGHKHVYRPGARADNTLGSFFSKNLNRLLICHLQQVLPINSFV